MPLWRATLRRRKPKRTRWRDECCSSDRQAAACCRAGRPQQGRGLMSRPYNLEEAAAKLRKTPRWLREWLCSHPADPYGEPYFTPVGRTKILHDGDIARIERDLRGELKCRSRSGRRAQVKRRITKYAGPTSDAVWKSAAELTGDPSLSKSSDKSRSVSSSTASIPRPNLSLVQESRRS